MLTDDASDCAPLIPFTSSALLSSPPRLLDYSTAALLTPAEGFPLERAGESTEHTHTQTDYSPCAVIEYVTNTLSIALGNQIKK